MTIYFFVGSEFSTNTDFNALNTAAKNLQAADPQIQKILFYPCSSSAEQINSLATSFLEGDVIIGASAGGGAAANLATAVKKHNNLLNPILIGFEPYGFENAEPAIILIQADDPKGMIPMYKDKHCIYQIKDDNGITSSGRKKYVYGHAFYAVNPSFVSQLDFTKVEPIDSSNYVIIPEASLSVGQKKYHYKNLIAKTNATSKLDASNGCRMFQYGFISNLIHPIVQGKNLEEVVLGEGFDLKRVTPLKKEPQKKPVGQGSFQFGFFPAFYNKLWDNKFGDMLAKAQAILQDYKKINWFMRILTGHWNRHHVSAVSELLKKNISNTQDLLKELHAIQSHAASFNPKGSLAKRIAFIEEQAIKQTALNP